MSRQVNERHEVPVKTDRAREKGKGQMQETTTNFALLPPLLLLVGSTQRAFKKRRLLNALSSPVQKHRSSNVGNARLFEFAAFCFVVPPHDHRR